MNKTYVAVKVTKKEILEAGSPYEAARYKLKEDIKYVKEIKHMIVVCNRNIIGIYEGKWTTKNNSYNLIFTGKLIKIRNIFGSIEIDKLRFINNTSIIGINYKFSTSDEEKFISYLMNTKNVNEVTARIILKVLTSNKNSYIINELKIKVNCKEYEISSEKLAIGVILMKIIVQAVLKINNIEGYDFAIEGFADILIIIFGMIDKKNN